MGEIEGQRARSERRNRRDRRLGMNGGTEDTRQREHQASVPMYHGASSNSSSIQSRTAAPECIPKTTLDIPAGAESGGRKAERGVVRCPLVARSPQGVFDVCSWTQSFMDIEGPRLRFPFGGRAEGVPVASLPRSNRCSVDLHVAYGQESQGRKAWRWVSIQPSQAEHRR